MNNVIVFLLLFISSNFNSQWSVYLFKKQYRIEGVDIKKSIKILEKEDSRLSFFKLKGTSYYNLWYEFEWGRIASFNFYLKEIERKDLFEIELVRVMVNRKKEEDSLRYFQLFDDEIIYRLKNADRF